MKTYARELTLFFTLLLACPSGHAAEQDNWYLANEWSVSSAQGVAYYEDNVTGIGQIYVGNGTGSSTKISVYDLNGSLARNITIASARYNANDLVLDSNGTIYVAEGRCVTCLENDGTFKWRTGKNASISSSGSYGSGNGEFSEARGIAIGPNGNLYVADSSNRRIQVLDKNGTFIRTFGNSGEAPGEFNSLKSVAFLHDDTLVVTDQRRIHWFQPDGTFVKRLRENDNHWEGGYMATSKSGEIITYVTRLPNNHYVRDVYVFNSDGEVISRLTNDTSNTYESSWRYAFTADGDLIISTASKIKLLKRAYRTKGLPVRNVIPQPAVRAITQRAGTNIIDLDFEIIDPDDANATVGILAAQDGAFSDTSKWILPQTWVDGTGSKIGTPIATNQVHRVSWNVKPDWPDSTGTLKFEIICQDARRTSPVDLHFLTLPLPDGNLTISRSPLKDSDFEGYAKFLLTTGQASLESSVSTNITLHADGNASESYFFANCGKTGRAGPSWSEMNATYSGTNLEGNVVPGFMPGYQEWTVPSTGTYLIEAIGARGGIQPQYVASPGLGAYMSGQFSLSAGQKLTIVVGQAGQDNPTADGGTGGGGASFVVADINNTPLIIAGGGSGQGGDSLGQNASIGVDGLKGEGSTNNAGTSGNGGSSTGSGGGFYSNGIGTWSGFSFQNGALGGDGGTDGGFGSGGGGSSGTADNGGGGGGYSGGGGSSGERGGGGGSFNSGTAQSNLADSQGSLHGFVRITKLKSGERIGTPPASAFAAVAPNNLLPSYSLKKSILEALGNGYRYATPEEVQKAREAATAGSVNQWTANRPIQPRNLPNKVNEYGFDTGDHGERAWWVVQE